MNCGMRRNHLREDLGKEHSRWRNKYVGTGRTRQKLDHIEHSREFEFYFRCKKEKRKKKNRLESFKSFWNDMMSLMFRKNPPGHCARGSRATRWEAQVTSR